MAMEMSMYSTYFIDLQPEAALEVFKRHGVTTVELGNEHGAMLLARSEDVRATGRAFGDFARGIGVNIPQGHLWLKCRLVSNPQAVETLKKWIDLYDAIGICNMVLHMDVYDMPDRSVEWMHDRNVEKLTEIAEYVRGRGFYICLENLFRRGADHIEQLQSVIARTGADCFGITLDTGHLNMAGTDTQQDFIRKAGGMLRAVHIADNEGAADQHIMPFGRGTVDFAQVVRALREAGYQGSFNFELPGEVKCPLQLREAKLDYIRGIYEYLMR